MPGQRQSVVRLPRYASRLARHPGMAYNENHSHIRHSWLRTHTSDALVARYYQELLHFCWRSLRNREAAADPVQDSYARVLGEAAVREPRALPYRTARIARLHVSQPRTTIRIVLIHI